MENSIYGSWAKCSLIQIDPELDLVNPWHWLNFVLIFPHWVRPNG